MSMEKRRVASNATTVTEFLLLGFSDTSLLQMVYFVLIALVYLIAVIGNLLLVTIVILDSQLHKPMYIFLANLSILDISYISLTIPKSMTVSLTKNRSISFSGCMAQIYLGIMFSFTEFTLLTVMAYDRYIAICFPLHYQMLMTKIKCLSMAAGCWVSSSIYSALHTLNIIFLPFCGPNNINQLFCDLNHVLEVVCANTFGNETATLLCGIVFGILFCSSVIASYVRIFLTVQKIPSSQGRYKAYSTCLPHLVVFSLFMITGLFTYLRKSSVSSFFTDILTGLLYSTVSPVANPVIYSLRNKEIKTALGKLINKTICSRELFSTKKKKKNKAPS